MRDIFGLNEVKIKYSSWHLIKDIAILIKPYRLRFFGASLIRFTGDVIWLYPPFALATLVTFLTDYKPGQSLDMLWTVAILWTLAMLARSISQFLAKSLGYRISEKVAIDASLQTLRHMFLLDMAWHERENSGNKVKRINNASTGLDKIIRIWFNSIIEIVVNFVGISFIILQFDTTVLVSLLLFLTTYFAISFVMTRRAGAASYVVNAREEEVSGLMFEAINNIRSVKIMAMSKSLFSIVSKKTEDLFNKIKIRIFRYQSRNSLLALLGYGFRLGMVIYIAIEIMQGRYELGFLVLFVGYFSNIWDSVDELSNATQEFVTSKFSVARMRDILNEPLRIDNEIGKKNLKSDWRQITVNHVSFSYGDKKILSDVSFVVGRGERVGIVGLSGAGKSTLFKLLLKEREEFTGDIVFDDVSIKDIRKADYFKQVSAVLQDTEVFNLSLRDNITITKPANEVSDSLLEQAVTTAHVTDFAEKLHDGLGTIIGEKGIKLSGGERQRLGIARAIFKGPQLLLLDEATSSLDSESEALIQDALATLMEGKTVLVIAHRLSTIMKMDRIVVLENGKVVAEGTHKELLEHQGLYQKLWSIQAGGFIADIDERE